MTFPTTPILDNFNRADGPLGANWLAGSGIWDVFSINTAQMYYATGANGIALDTWSTQYGPDCEAYFTLVNLNNTSFTWGIDFLIRCDDVEGNNSANFYDFAMGGTGLGVNNYNIYKSGLVSLKSGTLTVSNGDKFGISVIGTTINIYQDSGSGWTLVDTATDSDVAGAGYISLEIGVNGSVTIDDFGGGTLAGPTPPVADFSGTPTSGPAPLTVAFTDSSTGSPTSWAWTFGDGNTSTDQNPTNVYSTPGTYTVALTATNGAGDDTETKVGYITVLGAPVADFSGDTLTGPVPLTVNFTDLSTNSPDTWFWDFGDGGSSTSQNPTYIYAYTGVYTVTLTASSSAGSDSETKIDYITVTAVAETGPATIENCDIDTGGLAVGLRVSDVAYARDNRLGSVVIDASAELRVKDNSYSALTNNGTLNPLAGDRSVFDALAYATRHTNDADNSTSAIHHTLGTGADQAAAGDHAHAGMGTVTSVDTGVGLTGGPITTSGTIDLEDTAVVPGAYTNADITIDQQGRITAAANGTSGAGGMPQVYNETQTADGVTLTYYLANYASPATIRVYIDGIRQPASDDLVPTDVVTFSASPDAGALLLFDYEMDLA